MRLLRLMVLSCLLAGVSSCDDSAEVADSGPDTSDSGGFPDSDIALDGREDGPLPDRTFTGDFTIADADDVETFAVFTAITGDLSIRADDVTDIDLPRLRDVGGTLRISACTALEGLSIGDLRVVADDLVISGNANLTNLDGLGSVEEVQGDLFVAENDRLERVVLDSLLWVGDDLVIGSSPGRGPVNPALTTAGFPVITNIGGTLQIFGNKVLDEVELDALTEVGTLYIVGNEALPALNMGGVTEVDGNFELADNAELATFDLSGLTDVEGSSFRVADNPRLPTCLADALLARVRANGFNGDTDISGNDDGASCDDLCSPVGSESGGDVCQPDGTWAPACDNQACLENEQRLCEGDVTAPRFNRCTLPDSVTNTCDAGDQLPSQRGENGPIIWAFTFARDTTADTACGAAALDASAHTATFDYYDPDGDAHSSYSAQAQEAFVWVRAPVDETDIVAPAPASLDVSFSNGATGSDGSAAMTICTLTPPAEIAIQIADQAGNTSNGGCVAE